MRNSARATVPAFVCGLAMFFLCTGPVHPDEWDWKVAPYLWAVNLDGTLSVGPLNQDIDMSFSDILSDLDVGGSVLAGLGRGNHAVYVDYT